MKASASSPALFAIRRLTTVLRMRRSLPDKMPVERVLICATVALGLVHAWAGRYSMDPDGISYLDIGSALVRRDWTNALNAWWGPLYGWVIGVVIGIVKPSPKWEFPLVHVVNFSVFLLALAAFRFLLHSLVMWRKHRTLDSEIELSVVELPGWALVILGYGLFLWVSLEVETVYEISPDLAVMACVSLAAGMVLRLRISPAFWKFVLFGLVLGLGYWVKAILFPLDFASLTSAYLWNRSSRSWRRGIAVSSLAFPSVVNYRLCRPIQQSVPHHSSLPPVTRNRVRVSASAQELGPRPGLLLWGGRLSKVLSYQCH